MAIKRYVGDRFVGLSGDTKPTNVILGASFLETDTSDKFFFDGSTWVLLDYARRVPEWTDVSTTHTASSGERIFADTSGGAFTITLPSTPNSGDFVIITDGALTFDTNNLTISRNGENILGTADDLILDVDNASVELVYRNVTVGWLLIQR